MGSMGAASLTLQSIWILVEPFDSPNSLGLYQQMPTQF